MVPRSGPSFRLSSTWGLGFVLPCSRKSLPLPSAQVRRPSARVFVQGLPFPLPCTSNPSQRSLQLILRHIFRPIVRLIGDMQYASFLPWFLLSFPSSFRLPCFLPSLCWTERKSIHPSINAVRMIDSTQGRGFDMLQC